MMKKWNLIIDVETCIDCNACFLACKDEHVDNDFLPITESQPKHGPKWIDILIKERGKWPQIDVAYLPKLCMHCDEAPCMKKGKDGAVYKRDDGIVIIDPEKAKGQKGIVDACPYNVIWWNEEKNLPQKCTLCAHLLDDGWTQTRCVQVCPTQALRVEYVENAEMEKIIEKEGLAVLNPKFKTRPRVYYKNLYRYLTSFIAGSVAVKDGKITDCAENAKVTLVGPGNGKVAEMSTDNYGDFKFDNLDENSGTYKIEIDYAGKKKKTLEVDLKTSVSMGTINL